MDAIDPRVDYLKIDEWINAGRADDVYAYCKKLECDLVEVTEIWFLASDSDGIMIDGYYFEKFDIKFDRAIIGMQVSGQKNYLPGQQTINMCAESFFTPSTCEMFCPGSPLRIDVIRHNY